jgi:hypothetical protein
MSPGSAWADSDSPRGVWQGSGPACAGTLALHPGRSLSWQVPGSVCLKRPYRVLEHDGGGDRRPTLMEMPPRDAQCRHELLELHPPAEGSTAWRLLAYPTVADHRARRLDTALTCPLKKLS